jgi:hypothetical protein
VSPDEDDPGTRAEERRFAVVPGEPDDGTRWPKEPDPPDLGPDPPAVEAPNPSGGSPAVRRLFWTLVVVLDVAILAIALGIMFVGFERRWTLGGQLVLAGVVLLAYAWYKYHRYRRSQDDVDGV